MGTVIKNEELKAELVLPDPFTGKHWMAYQVAGRSYPREEAINRYFMGALAVMESGTYEDEAGAVHDIKAEGLNVPMGIMFWVAYEIDRMIAKKLSVPKN